MKTKCKVLVMLFLFTMGCVSDVSAQQPKYEIESLRGLKGVSVEIEKLSFNIEKDGLKREQIKTDVELKLRLAGIKVVTEEESINEPGQPYLFVNVNSNKSELGFYSFSITIELNQLVLLIRDLDTIFTACTWSTKTVGFAGVEKVGQIRDYIKDDVDLFINDYLFVNPK